MEEGSKELPKGSEQLRQHASSLTFKDPPEFVYEAAFQVVDGFGLGAMSNMFELCCGMNAESRGKGYYEPLLKPEKNSYQVSMKEFALLMGFWQGEKRTTDRLFEQSMYLTAYIYTL